MDQLGRVPWLQPKLALVPAGDELSEPLEERRALMAMSLAAPSLEVHAGPPSALLLMM